LLPVDLTELVKAIGYLGVTAIVFTESGLLIGFFLPGDSLLFTAGFLASQGTMNVWLLAGLAFVAAVGGDAVGYQIGHRVGRRLFDNPDSRFFKRAYLIQSELFFQKHGGKAVFLARFLPIIRTFTPVVAGMGAMSYPRFFVFNVLGALGWAVGVTLAGYLLGNSIPGVDRYLLPMIAVIILLSSLPSVVHILRERSKSARRRAVEQPSDVLAGD
jgi:membrane-associated protein